MVVRRFTPKKMKEIYLVTQGNYSNYGVLVVFTDKDLATEYAAQISNEWDVARVDARSIMTELVAPVGYRGYTILMDVDGNTDGVKPNNVSMNKDDSYDEYEFVCNNPGDWKDGGENISTGQFNFFINTDKGPEGAIKIANERRVRMIAENKWPAKGLIAEKY